MRKRNIAASTEATNQQPNLEQRVQLRIGRQLITQYNKRAGALVCFRTAGIFPADVRETVLQWAATVEKREGALAFAEAIDDPAFWLRLRFYNVFDTVEAHFRSGDRQVLIDLGAKLLRRYHRAGFEAFKKSGQEPPLALVRRYVHHQLRMGWLDEGFKLAEQFRFALPKKTLITRGYRLLQIWEKYEGHVENALRCFAAAGHVPDRDRVLPTARDTIRRGKFHEALTLLTLIGTAAELRGLAQICKKVQWDNVAAQALDAAIRSTRAKPARSAASFAAERRAEELGSEEDIEGMVAAYVDAGLRETVLDLAEKADPSKKVRMYEALGDTERLTLLAESSLEDDRVNDAALAFASVERLQARATT